MRTKKPKYFPNKIKMWQDVPSSELEPMDYEEFMDWRVGQWELHPHYTFIIREYIYDKKQRLKKVVAHEYKNAGSARNLLNKNLQLGDREFVIADHDAVHLLTTLKNATDQIDE